MRIQAIHDIFNALVQTYLKINILVLQIQIPTSLKTIRPTESQPANSISVYSFTYSPDRPEPSGDTGLYITEADPLLRKTARLLSQIKQLVLTLLTTQYNSFKLNAWLQQTEEQGEF